MKLPRSFCWRPFVELHINQHNRYAPCCKFISKNMYGSNTESDDIHRKVRDAILEDRWHPGCRSCKDIEDSGFSKSHRQDYRGPKDKNLVTENRFSLRHLEIIVDNVCNLACTTCSPFHSSRWESENKKMGDTTKYPSILKLQDRFLYEPWIWQDVEHLVLYGGEPMYSKNVLDLLRWATSNGFSENIELMFYTNGTQFNENIIQLLKSFKSVKIRFSIDATGDRYELLRWPASWTTTVDNFQRMSEMPNVETGVTYTLSILNIMHALEDMTDISSVLGTGRIGINLLTDPHFFSIRHLPQDIKDVLIAKMRSHHSLNAIIPELQIEGSPEELEKAKERLRSLDQHRKTDRRILGDIFD